MSETASAGDLKSSIKALVGKLDDLIKEAKEDKFDKTARAVGDVKTMFIKAVTADPKPETVTFYEAKLEPLGKILQAEKNGVAAVATKEGKALQTEFATLLKKANGDGKKDAAKKIEKIAAVFSDELTGNPSHGLVERYRKTLKELTDSLDKEADDEEEGEDDEEDEGGPCVIKDKNFLVAQLNHVPKLKEKYEEWLKDAKAKGPAAANKKHGFKSTKMKGGGNVKHFRLSGDLRVYYLKDGKTLTVSGPKHQK